MGKIKPTRVITPRIVQPGEGGRPWLGTLLLIILALWSWQVFEFGRKHAAPAGSGQRDQLEESLQQRIRELEEERDALRADVARFEGAGQIDRAAADDIQSEVKAIQEQRAELKREIGLLKSLVSGGDDKLMLGDANLTEIDGGSYRFEVTLSKRIDDQETVSGQVVLSVTGRLGGEDKILDMQALTGGSLSNIGIRFRNFQKLTTDLQLPAGFEPAAIQVSVRPDGQGFKSFDQVFDWKTSDT